MTLLTLLLLAIVPRETVAEQRVDAIEVNRLYDGEGRHVFDQAIFWRWDDMEGRTDILAWRLIKCRSQLPYRDHQRGGYAATWMDGDVLRRVRCGTFIETWTQHDPELEARAVLPKERRKELRGIRSERVQASYGEAR